MDAPQPAYDVFIAYASHDRDIATELHDRITAAGSSAFIDHRSLAPGSNFGASLREAQLQSRITAVIISDSFTSSPYLEDEIVTGLDLMAEDPTRHRIIPILLTSDDRDLPYGLRAIQTLRAEDDDMETVSDELLFVASQLIEEGSQQTARIDDSCPYRGMARYEESDAAVFFGRKIEIEQVVAALRGHRVVTLVGASGAGKSSLARAGLAPRLRGSMAVDIVTPSSDIDWLSLRQPTAVNQPPRRLLVIDQAEILWSETVAPVVRDIFIQSIVDLLDGSDVSVLIVMRSNDLPRAYLDRRLAPLLAEQQIPVLTPARSALRHIIIWPARAHGLHVEAALVQAILDDAAQREGILPLLSEALAACWANRSGDTMTHSAYRFLGGLEGVIERRAEATFASFDNRHQEIARKLLIDLVDVSGGSGPRPRQRQLAALLAAGEDAEAAQAVSGALQHNGLLVYGDQGTVTLTHEAIIKNWPSLSRWVDDHREDMRVLRLVDAAASDWMRAGRSPAYLLRGDRLRQAHDAVRRTGLNDDLRARYLRACRLRRASSYALFAASVVAIAVGAVGYAVRFGEDRAKKTELAAARRDAAGEFEQLANGIQIQTHEVTRGQYFECKHDGPCQEERGEDGSDVTDYQGESLANPARFVSAFDAITFCNFIGADLPTIDELRLWYTRPNVMSVWSDGTDQLTVPHASKPHVFGNVLEWTKTPAGDCRSCDSGGLPDRLVVFGISFKIVRQSSSASRTIPAAYKSTAAFGAVDQGFRCVRHVH